MKARARQEVEDDTTCTLDPASLVERLVAWREVRELALTRRSEPGRVEATYPLSVLPQLERLIAAEAECCSFLKFELRASDDIVELMVEFPPAFAPMVEALTAV